MAERSLADVVAEINEVKTRKKITEKELKQLDRYGALPWPCCHRHTEAS